MWEKLVDNLCGEPDLEWVMVDSTHIKVHQHGTGARGGDRAMTRANGGLNAKLPVAADKGGHRLRVMATEVTEPDRKRASDLAASLDTGYVLADKAYDSDEIIFSLSARSIIPIIPPKTNRKSQRFYDKNIYKKRHVIENFVPQNEWNDTPFPLNTSRIFTPLSRHSMFAPSLSLLPDFDDSLWIMTSLKPPLFA